MSTSPNPIPLSNEEDVWIEEHITAIKAMKQAKVEHQRHQEEEAVERQCRAEEEERQRQSEEAEEAMKVWAGEEKWKKAEMAAGAAGAMQVCYLDCMRGRSSDVSIPKYLHMALKAMCVI